MRYLVPVLLVIAGCAHRAPVAEQPAYDPCADQQWAAAEAYRLRYTSIDGEGDRRAREMADRAELDEQNCAAMQAEDARRAAVREERRERRRAAIHSAASAFTEAGTAPPPPPRYSCHTDYIGGLSCDPR